MLPLKLGAAPPPSEWGGGRDRSEPGVHPGSGRGEKDQRGRQTGLCRFLPSPSLAGQPGGSLRSHMASVSPCAVGVASGASYRLLPPTRQLTQGDKLEMA